MRLTFISHSAQAIKNLLFFSKKFGLTSIATLVRPPKSLFFSFKSYISDTLKVPFVIYIKWPRQGKFEKRLRSTCLFPIEGFHFFSKSESVYEKYFSKL